MFRLLIADKFPEAMLEEARSLGVDVVYTPEVKAETLGSLLGDCHALFVRSTKVTAAALQEAKKLMLIVRVGSGVNTIDVAEASRRGIYVANCPGKNAIAVAELTMGLLLALDRQIPNAQQALASGLWQKKRFSKADGLKEKTLGLAGWGQIAKEVAKRAAAFEMEILVWSRSLTPKQASKAGVGHCATLAELAERADVLSIHLPLTPETKGIIDESILEKMPKGAIFLNTSRGEIHDQEALWRAMQSRGLRVGLDVFSDEPEAGEASYHHPMLQSDAFVGTPHIGASTEQAQRAVASEALRILRAFLQEGIVHQCVNLKPATPTPCHLVVRHYNKVGVLAQIMSLLSQASINIENMSNTIFQGSHTASVQMQLSRTPPDEFIQKLESMHDLIIQVTTRE
jgi:D-3-phosphoglycerate dehydrogenase